MKKQSDNVVQELPNFDSMSKKALDEWAEVKGIKLDRRLTKKKMISELKKHL
tara:strand:+ start:564 stop:719 length:156 start_codon:yes stop_codon:yes gene_type:complete